MPGTSFFENRACAVCYPSPVRTIRRKAWLLVLLSSLLQVLIFPLPGLYCLSWVAFAPLLLAVLQARHPGNGQSDSRGLPATPWQGFLLGYVSGILWYAGTCYWVYDTMHIYGGLSAPLALLVLCLFCLYLGLYHGAFGLLLAWFAGARNPVRRFALLVVPFLWVALELARTRISGFPWDLLGTVQVDNVPLAHVAKFTGVYGLSFEILLVNTAVALAFLVIPAKRARMLMAALLAALVLQSGRWIPSSPPPANRLAVLVQSDIPILDPASWTTGYFRATLAGLEQTSMAATRSADRPVELIAWPESPAPFYTNDPVFREALTNLARSIRTPVVAGSIGTTNAMHSGGTTQVFNSAALVSSSGDWLGRYDKIHLVPFGEYLPFPSVFSFAGGLVDQVGSFTRGTSRQPLPVAGTPYGVFICYEAIFPDEVRQFAKNGAQAFLNISNDGWYGDSGAYAQHLLQARMRAMENERWILRDTNTGVTASIDPHGRVVATLPRKQRAALLAPFAQYTETTFYTRHGDWFAYLCAIISVVALSARLLPRKKA
jgi:apolipoprotein N-acyltransferase